MADNNPLNPYAPPRAALADAEMPALTVPPAQQRWFHRSFWASFVLAGICGILLLGRGDPAIFALVFLAMLMAGCVHLWFLGAMALRTGRSVALWVAAAVLLAPFGYLAAYARMHMLIRPDEEITAPPPAAARLSAPEQRRRDLKILAGVLAALVVVVMAARMIKP